MKKRLSISIEDNKNVSTCSISKEQITLSAKQIELSSELKK